MNFACLYLADFPVQAVVRGEPELHGRAVAVMEPEPPPFRVFALNEAARTAGAENGMSRVEVALLQEVEVRRRSPAAEVSAHAALLDLARSFSPRFEDVAADTVVLDLGGLETLLGSAAKVAQGLAARARELGMDANLALAPNPDAARLAARGFAGITLIGEDEEADRLGGLPVEVLDPSLEMQETLARWGIRTFRALAALPAAELSERLGQEGVRLQTLARGGALRALVPAEEPLHFEEAMDLEYPVAEIEPLAFILSRLLNQLCVRLGARGRATQELRLALALEGGHENRIRNPEIRSQKPETNPKSNPESRTLRLPVPTRDSKLLLKLWLFDLEARPPSAPVLKVAITAEPTRPRVAQGDLFLPRAPDPQKLGLTLARLKGVVGEGKTGSPELLDTNRPDAFRMQSFAEVGNTVFESRKSKAASRNSKFGRPETGSHDFRSSIFDLRTSKLTFRLFRPPLAASVEVQDGRLVRLESRHLRGRVVWASGPWHTSGDWWTGRPWDCEEWDVEVSVVSGQWSVVSGSRSISGIESRKSRVKRIHLYRIYRDLRDGLWFVSGLYD
jgi:protein ImuB